MNLSDKNFDAGPKETTSYKKYVYSIFVYLSLNLQKFVQNMEKNIQCGKAKLRVQLSC